MRDFKILAVRLKELRNNMQLTQKEFADKVGFTQATLSAYENTQKKPSLDIIMDIAEKCEVSIDWLCGLSDKKSYKTYINTYSDIGIMLLDISHYIQLTIEDVKYYDIQFNEVESTGIVFNNTQLTEFLNKWKKIKDLYEEKTIDSETYLNIMTSFFNTYSIPVEYNENLFK